MNAEHPDNAPPAGADAPAPCGGCRAEPGGGDAAGTARHTRAALLLQYLTIGYNVVEGVVCVALGAATGGLAILAFGLDSFVEVLASLVMVRRLRFRGSPAEVERAELRARRGVGVTFFILGGYVLFEAVRDLAEREPPEQSILVLVIAAFSAVAMPLLGRLKRRLATRMRMSSLASEAAQTTICGWLSLILLLAVGAHHLTDWWWVDAVGALAMLPIIIYEGVGSFRGKACDCD